MTPAQELQDIIEKTADHASADFYRRIWGGERTYTELPSITRQDLLRTPLSRRRYAEGRSIVKLVHAEEGSFLSEWRLEDLREEPFAQVSQRPLVYLADAHEALEKSVWCYEHGVVPLIGEADPAVAAYAASKYHIDSIITDPAALMKLAPKLHTISDSLERITIIGTSFDPEELMFVRAFAKHVSLVFALPETGAIACTELQASPTFESVSGSFVERHGTMLTVTKHRPLVTPIIKYDLSQFSDLF